MLRRVCSALKQPGYHAWQVRACQEYDITPRYSQTKVTLKTKFASITALPESIAALRRTNRRFHATVSQACLMVLDRSFVETLGILLRIPW